MRGETSGKKNMSFKEFKETKEKQRGTFFRKKPGRGKGSGKQQEDLNDTVKINIGIMVPDSVQLRRVRGKSLTVKVPKNATAERGKAHSKDIIKQEYNYVLPYEGVVNGKIRDSPRRRDPCLKIRARDFNDFRKSEPETLLIVPKQTE